MRAITLHQPWATLVALGEKKIETRSWGTDFRGPLAIHAGKALPDYALDFYEETPAVRTMLNRAGIFQLSDLPFGAIVATCQIVGCVSTNTMDISKLGKDRILGNFGWNRFAWLFEDVCRLPEPIPARGYQNLWEWDNEAAGVEVLVTGRLF